MTTTSAHPDRAVSDPIGLIAELIAAVDHALAPERIREVVTSVARGRAKARRLAAALAQRPGVLVDGRSPAPRAVAELLRACVAPAPKRSPHRAALSAANICGASSAAANTGTARSATDTPNRAPAAGTPEPSPRETAVGNHAASTVRTSTGATRSR
jgi:hypothetical protein